MEKSSVSACQGGRVLVSRDVYIAIGYEEENGRKAIQNLVPSKYKLRFGDVNPSPSQGVNIFPLHKDTVLLKEPGLYCFLLRCKRDEANEAIHQWNIFKSEVIKKPNYYKNHFSLTEEK